MAETISTLSQSTLGVLMFFGILVFLTLVALLIFFIVKNKNISAKIAGQEVQVGGEVASTKKVSKEELIQKAVEESREEDDSITIGKFVFAQLLDSCLEKAMEHSTDLTKASIVAADDQKEKIHKELTTVIVQMVLEYGQRLESASEESRLTNSELLNFELEKDFKEHLETTAQSSYTLENLKSFSDDDLKETATNIVRIALPQLKLSLNRYDILNKEIIYEILSKQENNLVEALRNALREARKISNEYNDNKKKQALVFRKDILRSVEARVNKDLKEYILIDGEEL